MIRRHRFSFVGIKYYNYVMFYIIYFCRLSLIKIDTRVTEIAKYQVIQIASQIIAFMNGIEKNIYNRFLDFLTQLHNRRL